MSKADIAKQASDLLNAHGLMHAPVDIETAAKKLGVNVSYQQLEDAYSGMLVLKGGAAHIIINDGHHPNRQRFTLAHELGHFLLHVKNSTDRLFIDTKFSRSGPASSPSYRSADSSTTYAEEREANLFAEALLVPEQLLKKCIKEKQIDVQMIDEFDVSLLASLFAVSEQMMAIRVEKL